LIETDAVTGAEFRIGAVQRPWDGFVASRPAPARAQVVVRQRFEKLGARAAQFGGRPCGAQIVDEVGDVVAPSVALLLGQRRRSHGEH